VATHQVNASANQAATCVSTKPKRNGRGQGTRRTSHQTAQASAIARPPRNPPAMTSSHDGPGRNVMVIMIGRAVLARDWRVRHSTYPTCNSANRRSRRRIPTATLRLGTAKQHLVHKSGTTFGQGGDG
jgi:hypothetical protein